MKLGTYSDEIGEIPPDEVEGNNAECHPLKA
jgi:hypothetical protein